MAKVTWSQGGPRALAAKIEGIEANLLDQAQVIVKEVTDIALNAQVQRMEDMVTMTGIRRVASGRGAHAGRIDTGAMVGNIDTSVATIGNTVRGEWGWINHYEDYYGEQENGTEKIMAANSLLFATDEARQALEEKLDRIEIGFQ